jgi:hypothetical protein
MTVERYLSIRIIKWRSSYFKSKQAVILSIVMGIILTIINGSFVSFIDYDTATTNITYLISKGNIDTMSVSIFCIQFY